MIPPSDPYKTDGGGGWGGTIVVHDPLPVFPTTELRIYRAKVWIDSLYQSDGYYGYMKEHPGLPISIHARTIGDIRSSGDYRERNLWPPMDVSRVTEMEILPYSDVTQIGMEDEWDEDYNEPLLTAIRTYSDTGYTDYKIVFNGFDGNSVVDVYLGDTLLWADVKTKVAGSYLTMRVYSYKGIPCNKYALRHANRLGQFVYIIWGDATKADWLAKLRWDYGFTYDIYDPMFGVSASEAGDFMFTAQAYPDTRDVWRALPRGLAPHRFPYYSKVQVDRFLYIAQSRTDTLLRMLQAIHYLNKYGNPYYRYDDPVPFMGTVTPIDIAVEAWVKWNDIGIPHPADYSVTSGVRTAVFLTLATLLGYKYGVADMKEAADTVFEALTSLTAPQAGMYPIYYATDLMTMENGLLRRPPYRGSFYSLYSRYTAGGGVGVAAIEAPSNILGVLTDLFNMPMEDPGPVPSNVETTITMLQALRVYIHYAQGIDYPSNGLLP